MNKLREELDSVIPQFDTMTDSDIDQLEQITDDFSISFGEYLRYKLYDENLTTTELQQYFKENVYGK
jgi:hypothetical protein